MSWALLFKSYFRHVYPVSRFHRIRKNHYFSRTSKAESWEQVRAPEQLPLTNSVMYTQLHIALHICCMQQWKSVKQILFPVPRCWWCRMVQHCRGDRTGCPYRALAIHFIYQQMTACWVSGPHPRSSDCRKTPLFPFYKPRKWSVYRARSQKHKLVAASKLFSELPVSYHLTLAGPKYQYFFLPQYIFYA